MSESTVGSANGEILAHYGRLRWENGILGYPTSDESCGLVRGGCWNDFQTGAIYWSPGIGAHFIKGGIRYKWSLINWEFGKFGYPITDEFCGLVQGGCGQHFELENGSIYWTEPTGPHTVQGLIKRRWAELGWERSALGYPTTDEFPIPNGVQQNYQGGFLAWTGGAVYGETWRDRAASDPASFGTASPQEMRAGQERRSHAEPPLKPPAQPRNVFDTICATSPSNYNLKWFFYRIPQKRPLFSGRTFGQWWLNPLECGDGGYGYLHIRHDHHDDPLTTDSRWTDVFRETAVPVDWDIKMRFMTSVTGFDPATPEPAYDYDEDKYLYTSQPYDDGFFRHVRIRVVISATNHGRIITSYPLKN